MTENLYKIPDDCNFMSIQNAHVGDNECSPVLLDPYFGKFSGLLINGPKEVVWSKKDLVNDSPPDPFGHSHGPLRLMLAGLIRLKYSTMGLNGEFGEHVMLVAVDQKTAQTYSGRMPSQDSIPEPEPVIQEEEVIMPEETLNSLVRSFFNFDLVSDLGLPISNASYTVYAVFGEFKSNVITIKTIVK